MRGYHGSSKFTSFYSWNPVKYDMQKGPFFSDQNNFEREYPIGWVGIDGDEKVTEDFEVCVRLSYFYQLFSSVPHFFRYNSFRAVVM